MLACSCIPGQPYAVSAGSDGQVLLWDTSLQRPVASWRASEKALLSCAVSPDGLRVLTGSLEGLLAQWELATHRRLSIFLAHPRPVSAIAFSPDGARLATSSWDGSVLLWKACGEGKPITFAGHQDIVSGCRFTADGRRLFSWAYDGSLRLWDVQWGRPVTQWNGHSDRITAGDASPDGKWLVTAGRDGHVILWDAANGQEVARYAEASSDVRTCLFAPDAELLLVVSGEGEITTLTVPELGGAVVEEVGGNIQCAALSRSGDLLVVGTDQGLCHFYPQEAAKDRPLCVTPYEAQENRPGFFQRLLKIEMMHRVLRCVCPICGHHFSHETPANRRPHCPRCRRAVKINDFAFAEPPVTIQPLGSSSSVVRKPTFYPTPVDAPS